MTLRVWALLLFIGLYFLVTTGAHAGDWEKHRGVIKAVELNGDQVQVEVKTENGNKTLTLCSDPAQIPFDRPREDKLNLIRDAFKTGEVVELGEKGPWSPCLNSIRLSKGA